MGIIQRILDADKRDLDRIHAEIEREKAEARAQGKLKSKRPERPRRHRAEPIQRLLEDLVTLR